MKQYDVERRFYKSVPSVMGRPKKFESVEELQKLIEEYFDSCFVRVHQRVKTWHAIDKDDQDEYEMIPVYNEDGTAAFEQIRPLTITGLAVALDTSRETLLDYENKPENADFSDTIKKAKQIIHRYAEEYLFDGKNQTGAIFNLKNNWGWVDRTETDLTTKGKPISAAVAAKVDDILKDDDENPNKPA